jgi:hypothetical protein
MLSETRNRSRHLRAVAAAALTAIIAAVTLVPAAPAGADVFQTTYRDEVMADAPAAYWRLGESSGTTMVDETGVNNGTYTGVTLGQAGALPFEANAAAGFNGTSARASVPDSVSLRRSGAVTVEAWIKRTKSAQYQVVLGKPGHGQSKLENYALWINTSNRVQAFFGNGNTYVTVTSVVLDTNWHHIVATYDNATARLYLDGAQNAQATSTVQLTPNNKNVDVARSSTNSYYFGGTLDEVAVYPTVLSAARVQAHFAKTTADTSAPAVTLTQPAAASSTNDTTPAFAGVAGTASGDSTAVTVRVFAGAGTSGTLLQTLSATSGPGGSYSVSASSALADGTYTARAEQSDSAGNTGLSTANTFTVDTAAPSVSITGGPSGATNSTSADFTFSSEAGAGFECKLDNGAYAPCTSPKPYGGLAGGEHTFSVRAIDAAGNTSGAATRTWTVDTTAPAVSITGGPNDPTNSLSASFTFSAEAGAGLDCKLDNGAYAPCTSPQAYSGLSDGQHTFSVRATDAAGNSGSASRTWTVDTTPPALTLTAPADGSTIGDTTPAIGGVAGTASGDAGSITVRLYSGSSANGSPLQTLTATRSGGGAYTVNAAALAAGTYTAQSEQGDNAGNVTLSGETTFTVDPAPEDTTPPVVVLTAPANGSVTADQTPAFSGTAGTASGDSTTVTIKVHAGTTLAGTLVRTLPATRAGNGSFSVDASPALADGTYTARAEQSDDASNTGFSGTTTFQVDSTAPNLSLTSPSDGSSTSDATPALSGVAGTASGDGATVTVRLYTGSSATGSPLQTLTATRGGGGSYSVDAAALGNGTYTARASQDDAAGNTGQSGTTTFVVDTVAPVITLTAPANGASLQTTTPTFSGTAGTLTGDSTTVTIRIYSGSTATGSPVQTLTTTRGGGGSYSTSSTGLSQGTYTARAEQSDAAGSVGLSSANTFTLTGEDPVMIGAGDITSCENTNDSATAALLAQYPSATVFTLGDNAYVNGQPSEYTNCYGPSWGVHKARTRPITGGHDTATVNGGALPNQGFADYFQAQLAPYGETATNRLKSYYSYNVGAWHVVALNSACYYDLPGCNPSAMEQWFRDDLAASNNVCTMVYWHDARWSSGNIHGNESFTQPLWQIAYDGGADIVLSGNEHDYERFAPQDANGALDTTYGVRAFVVGTGGYYLYDLGTRQPNSQVYDNSTYGVLKLTLHPTSYDWQFIPVAGETFTDSGTDNCHSAPAPPSGTPTVRSKASASAPYPSTSLTIARPAGTAAGDLLVATIAHQGGSGTNVVPPAGFTNIAAADVSEGSNARIHSYWKVATGSEPASYAFTLSNGMSIAGGVMAIQGASTTAPINAAGGQSTGATNVSLLTAPSITTTKPNTALVYSGAVNNAVTFTAPQLMPEQWDLSGGGTYKIATETAVGGVAAAGPTGTRAATLSSSARGVATSIAIAGP